MNEEAKAFSAGMTFQEFAAGIRVHRADYLIHHALLAGVVDELKRNPPLARVRTLAIVEDWCPDCVFNLPIIARLAEASDAASLRIVRRPDHRLLANRFTGRGQVSRVPTFVFLRADDQVIGHWSERCAFSQQWFDAFTQLHPMPVIEVNDGIPTPLSMRWMQLRIRHEAELLHAGAWREVLREVRSIVEAPQSARRADRDLQ